MIHTNKVCCFLFLVEVPLVQRVGKNTRFLHVLSTEHPQLLLQTEKKKSGAHSFSWKIPDS